MNETTDSPERGENQGLDARSIAAAKREARARRIRGLRRRITGGALALFVIAWGAIAGQSYLTPQVSGSTGAQPAPVQTQSTGSGGGDEYGEDSGEDYEEDDAGAAPVISSAPSVSPAPSYTPPSPVTTTQS
jgi:hypothetical protein